MPQGAGATVARQGNSLYCFTVVTWSAPRPKPFWNSEAELANNWKQYGLHVLQCDGSDIIDGWETPKAEWGSFSNIDAFLEIWQKVKENGKWEDHDWIVKVDSDAVFFPNRLKLHLDQLRVPKGARVYLENNDYRFKFMGALEVVSQPGMRIWLDHAQDCIHGKHEGGEDFFMKGCMDGLGLDHMIDHQLLSDTYAGQDPHCVDGWVAAFHFHKKVIRWNWCYNEVMCGSREACDEGLPVEYVMDDGTDR
jgi:hypothetical protein